jgi:hypothetical protein
LSIEPALISMTPQSRMEVVVQHAGDDRPRSMHRERAVFAEPARLAVDRVGDKVADRLVEFGVALGDRKT